MPQTTTPAGTTLSHATTGAGTDLVLVHGITESSAAWAPLVEPLAAAHRVTTVDLPGHGGSSAAGDGYGLAAYAADLQAVLDDLGIVEPVVLGHSLGGFVAAVHAGANPVRAVAVVDQPLALAGFKAALAPLEPALRSDGFGDVVGAMFAEYMAPLPADEQARLTSLRRPDQDVVLGTWDPVFSMDEPAIDGMVRDLLAGLDAPLLSLHGAEPGEEYRAWLGDVVPHAEVEVWEGSAHYPHLLHPARFVARVEELLAAA